jgi:DNA-binding transcriptional LysR family regulator
VLGHTLRGPLPANFLNEYPDVRLVSVLGDHVVHLLRSDFDLALAVGPLANSDLGICEN